MTHFLYLPFDFKDHQCYNMHQRSIHVYTVSVGHICLSIHPLTQSGSFHPLTIMNKDVVNIHDILLYARIPSVTSGIYPGVLAHLVTLFNVLGKCPTILYSQCQFSTSSQILYIIAFLKKMIAILGCVKWYFIEVLICISLKAKEIEYLFIFFIFSLSIYMSSLEKCLVNYLHRFFSLGHLSFYCRVL